MCSRRGRRRVLVRRRRRGRRRCRVPWHRARRSGAPLDGVLTEVPCAPLPLEDDVLVRAVRGAVDDDKALQSAHAGVAEVGLDALILAAILLKPL